MNKIRLLILLSVMSVLSNSSSITLMSSSSYLSGICQNSPFWKINICNITCDTCMSTNNNLCSSCQANYTLDSNYHCKLSNNTYTYYYSSYLTSTQISSSQASNFQDTVSYNTLGIENTVSICQNSTYQFQMLGLFLKEDVVGIQMTYAEQINRVTIKFNFLTLVNDVTITIYLNGQAFYSLDFTTLSNLTASYYDGSNGTNSCSYLNVPSLSASTASTIMQSISADLQITTSSLFIEIDVISDSNYRFWGISDLVVLGRQCDTCPTYQLTSTMSNLGTYILYTSAIVFPLLLLFFGVVKLELYRRQQRYLDRVGEDKDNKSNLPIKIINRVEITLSQLTKKVSNVKQMAIERDLDTTRRQTFKDYNKFI